MPIQVARMALTGQGERFDLALEGRGAGLRRAGLRGAGWPLRPLAGVDGLPRPPDFGRGTGVVVRVATVVTVRERDHDITHHTPAGHAKPRTAHQEQQSWDPQAAKRQT
jgi:hypothetical protein